MDPILNSQDLIDRLITDWKKEKPELNTSAMEVVGRILYLGKVLEKRASKALKSNNIYYTDLDVLATLRRSGEPYQLSPSQLRESVILTSGAMTTLLDRLEKMGLLSRKPSPNDGRMNLACLTSKGKEVIDKAIVVRFKEAASAIEVFTQTEKDQFSLLLKKLVLSLD